MKKRDFHKLAIIRGEARGYTTTVPSKKCYRRREKHQKGHLSSTNGDGLRDGLYRV